MLLQMEIFPFLFVTEYYASVCVCVCICIYIHYIFTHSSVDEDLVCFHILAVVDDAVMNVGVHVSALAIVNNTIVKIAEHVSLI